MSKSIQTISAEEFLSNHADEGRLTVIDVRTPGEVGNENFAGSINLPLQNLDANKFSDCISDADCGQEAPIYILCGSGVRAQKAAMALHSDISNPLIVIEGGIQAMKRAGAQIEQGGSSVISLDRQVRVAAGTLTLLGVILGVLLHPGFYALSAFIGAGLTFSGITDTCAMGTLIAQMPWNRNSQS